MEQNILDDLAETLGVSYKVLDNLVDGKKTYRAQITLTNNSTYPLQYDDWAIYFSHIRMIEPGHLPRSSSYEIPKSGVCFTHINGCLFKLSPTKKFKTLKKGDALVIKIKAQHYSVARSDLMPNWYFLYPKLKPKLIKSTVGEDLKYVEPFDKPETWKRFDYELADGQARFDLYNPYNLQERFERQKCGELETLATSVLPTPHNMHVNEEMQISLLEGDWSVTVEGDLEDEAQYLAEKLKIPVKSSETASSTNTILLKLSSNIEIKDQQHTTEAYELIVTGSPSISIVGGGAPGVFYGIQTLLSICKDGSVQECDIKDGPRYDYRGMHLDVSRNFHSKAQVLKLLETMAMYKMNKFHFHLTDDEGWRLEIPGLEELTTVGSRRGHVNSSDMSSLLPLLGAGPGFDSSGSGFYTVEDYREILRFAKQRHIEVIPEIDMPGHSHAAIRSMKARYQRFMTKKDRKRAEEYLLTDLDHDIHGSSTSVQMFSENAMNPGLQSTYKFIHKVATEVKKMHEDIAPLNIFHFGGDEVPYEAWEGSPACISLVESEEVKSFEHLMEYFVSRTADVIAKCKLDIGAWQDGVIPDEASLKPISRTKFKSKEVYVYAWQNVWESGLAGCAYRLANAGYKVIMSQGTHLYFDHPYEPDPEERGLYWACRFADTRKVFTFMPDNIYSNIDVKLSGEPLTKDFIKFHKRDHDQLKKPENVIGVQGQLWTELVRTWDQMDSMIFPRLLCVAERGWHKASWELETDIDKLKEGQAKDWDRFAQLLGQKELERLDKLGVAYHLPPPGARCSPDTGKLELNSAYPGLPIFYSTDAGKSWTQYTSMIETSTETDLQLCTRSVDGKRSSRVVEMKKLDAET